MPESFYYKLVYKLVDACMHVRMYAGVVALYTACVARTKLSNVWPKFRLVDSGRILKSQLYRDCF
jgi:hypothetical protein